MKILWISTIFLHPPNRGGRIRTLNLLRQLNEWHEVHYLALQNPYEPQGFARSGEYSARSYSVAHMVPPRRSVLGVLQAAGNLVSPLPLAVSRYRVPGMKRRATQLLEAISFDHVVCDFLAAAPNVPRLEDAILFQHNVETIIWQRQHEQARGLIARIFFGMQARKMLAFEREVCRRARHIIAVSKTDAERMSSLFGVDRISHIATSVDVEFFRRPATVEPFASLCFLGSMDWIPNIDAVTWFTEAILPRIWERIPDCTFAIIGRNPPPAVLALGARDHRIRVTGTVDDIRPYLFGSLVSVVPLRVGGGTRLKIYEAMAARVPVVSTRVGFEGLEGEKETIVLADSEEDMAEACVALLQGSIHRERIADAAWEMVSSRFKSESVARDFCQILENVR